MPDRAEPRPSLLGLAWRESRTTRRRLLLYMSSISLGVAALVGIDSFAANITRSVREQSRALVGGDISFSSRQRWAPGMDTLFRSLESQGMTIARVTTFGSMAFVPRTGRTRLAQVRAVTPDFPLYGAITTSPPDVWERLGEGMTAMVDPSLLIALDARVGDSISLGYARFEIAGQLETVPGDPGVSSVIGPRIFIAERNVEATKLLTFGSRADYEAFARVTTGDPAQIVQSLDSTLKKYGARARPVSESEGFITENISDLSNYLGIVGVVALLLGGVGVASGVHAWVRRKIDSVAVLRCLGATGRQILLIYVTQAGVMGLLGALVGAALGVGIQFALPVAFGDFLPVDVTLRLEPTAVLTGVGLGLWIALAFALRPLLALRRVSPLQALRRDADPATMQRSWRDWPQVLVNVLLAVSVVGVAATRARSPRETAGFSIAIAAVLIALFLSAWLLGWLARRAVRAGWPYVIRQGLANLHRPANQTRAVVLSLGFGAFLITTLYLVQANLLQQFAIADASARGNLLFFDVQDDQVKGLDSLVRTSGQEVLELTPIVTMRVNAINGRLATELAADTTRPSWPLRREYRSSFRSTLTPSEKVLSGTFFGAKQPAGDAKVFEVSLEREIAADMRVALGDTITWDVQGVKVPTVLTSIREVNWARFETNFFAIFQPGALDKAPKMWVSLLRVPDPGVIAQLQRDAVERWPNVASIDLSLIRKTVNDISRKATLAVRFLAIFSLAMGIPVLFSAVAATRRERVREGVLLKVLGATRRQIGRILFSEYAALGLLGSLTGMLLSFGGAWAIMKWVFERPFDPAGAAAPVIALAMLALAVAIGVLSGRDVFRETPMGALRQV